MLCGICTCVVSEGEESDSDKCHPSSHGHSHAGVRALVLENWHEEDNLTSCVNPDFSGKGVGWGSLDRQMLLKTWNAAKYSPPRYRLYYYPPPLPSVFSKAQWERRGDR